MHREGNNLKVTIFVIFCFKLLKRTFLQFILYVLNWLDVYSFSNLTL